MIARPMTLRAFFSPGGGGGAAGRQRWTTPNRSARLVASMQISPDGIGKFSISKQTPWRFT
jgi:hypothetical protein